jgi:hypothetical protein
MSIIKECKDGTELYKRFRKMLKKGEHLRIARTFYVHSLDEKCGPRQRRGDTLFYPILNQGFTIYPFKRFYTRKLKSVKIPEVMYDILQNQVPFAAIMSMGPGPKLCNLLKRLDDLGVSISFTVYARSYYPDVKQRELYDYDSSTPEDEAHVREYRNAAKEFEKILQQSKAQA